MSEQWPDWAERLNVPARGERQSMQRLVRYEVRNPGGALDADPRREGTGLTINVGDGGLCLLLDWAPTVGDILLLEIVSPAVAIFPPRSAEVRWVTPLPLAHDDIYLVGMKFVS
ncbi:MAG TPA: hypothetical protein VNK46_10505 [Nitrospiraceae bacterium]|jgi:hypothetical protein|nr:hypothetical protein [Nitrospiraceae bacterium]